MVVMDALHGDSAAAAADELFGGGTGYADLQDFFDHMAPEVKASARGSDGEEELEWLSNKDAFPTVETMDLAWARPRTKGGVRQSRAAVTWSAAEGRPCRHCGTQSTPLWRDGPRGRRTLCNACGIQYRAGRLLPEYRPARSPTFSSELHSNRHHRIAELRRRRGEAVQTSLAAAGCGKEAGQELERLSNRSVFLAVDTMAPAGHRPRTKGLQRRRRVVAWSPPPPPRTPAQERIPGGGADGGRAAATAAGGGLGGDAAADEARVLGQRLNQPGGEMALDSCTAGGGAADKGRAVVAAAPSGGVVDDAARAAAAALRTPAQRWCQHCGTETTPQWRKGPDGKCTLCNACGLWYKKSGGLVPQYRPASSPNFSPTLHSSRRSVVQRRRASPVVTTAIAAAGDAGDKWRIECSGQVCWAID